MAIGRPPSYRCRKSRRSSIWATLYRAASRIQSSLPSAPSQRLLNSTTVRSGSSSLNTCAR